MSSEAVLLPMHYCSHETVSARPPAPARSVDVLAGSGVSCCEAAAEVEAPPGPYIAAGATGRGAADGPALDCASGLASSKNGSEALTSARRPSSLMSCVPLLCASRHFELPVSLPATSDLVEAASCYVRCVPGSRHMRRGRRPCYALHICKHERAAL